MQDFIFDHFLARMNKALDKDTCEIIVRRTIANRSEAKLGLRRKFDHFINNSVSIKGFRNATAAPTTPVSYTHLIIPAEGLLSSWSGNIQEKACPVSYTHLDVYKRQASMPATHFLYFLKIMVLVKYLLSSNAMISSS